MSDAAQRQQQLVRIQDLRALADTLMARAEHVSMKAWIQQVIDGLREAEDSLDEPNASDRPRTSVDTGLDGFAHTLSQISQALTTHGSDAEVLDDDG